MPWKWERLDAYTQRAKVIGGWVLQSNESDYDAGLLSIAITFIADPDHEWIVTDSAQEKTDTGLAQKVSASDFEAPKDIQERMESFDPKN